VINLFKPVIVGKKRIPPRFETGTTTNRHREISDTTSVNSEWLERGGQWIHRQGVTKEEREELYR